MSRRRRPNVSNGTNGNDGGGAMPLPGLNRVAGEQGPVLDARIAFQVLSALTTRSGLATYLGKSFSGDRDIYEALGYTVNPTFKQFFAHYDRQDIASAVIDRPVEYSWGLPPTVTESDAAETPFEAKWQELVEDLGIYDLMEQVDTLASIGAYAILFLGFDDQNPMSQPVSGTPCNLLYLMPYDEASATIRTWVVDPKNPRYGQPESYGVSMRSMAGAEAVMTQVVHWTRVVHVTQKNLGDRTIGRSRLRNVLNRLENIELVAGGSAETFWRGAFPGIAFTADPSATIDKPGEVTAQIESYMHGFKRYLQLQGIEANTLQQTVADPGPCIDALVGLISSATGIPKRILMGSERGELSSSQDEAGWSKLIMRRQRKHCAPRIVRPVIDRCIRFGAVPTPARGKYEVKWQDLLTPGDKDRADAANVRSQAIKNYMDSGAEAMIPARYFLERELGYSRSDIDKLDAMKAEQGTLADGTPADQAAASQAAQGGQ